MQYLRTFGWILLTFVVGVFLWLNNGERHDVIIWPSGDGNDFLFEWPVGVIALVFFLLGLIPTWLYHRGVKWSLNRRIRSLENAVKSNALNRHDPTKPATPPAAPVASDTKPGDTLTPASEEQEKL